MVVWPAPAEVTIDCQSTSQSVVSIDFGIVSHYASRLESTVLARALDIERARRPEPIKFGRLARTQVAGGTTDNALPKRTRATTSAFHLVHVTSGSFPRVEAV